MTPRELEEYKALRATVRERGTARVWIFVTGLIAWAALLSMAARRRGFAQIPPALVLTATFEAVYALHVGVERIGRYIQVFFEDAESVPGWEGRIMEFGRRAASTSASGWPLTGSGDALFCVPFCAAALAGAFTAASSLRRFPWPRGVALLFYVFLIARLLAARRHAARQRERDLEHFRQLR